MQPIVLPLRSLDLEPEPWTVRYLDGSERTLPNRLQAERSAELAAIYHAGPGALVLFSDVKHRAITLSVML